MGPGWAVRSRRPRRESEALVRRSETIRMAAADARQRGSYALLSYDEYHVNPTASGGAGESPVPPSNPPPCRRSEPLQEQPGAIG